VKQGISPAVAVVVILIVVVVVAAAGYFVFMKPKATKKTGLADQGQALDQFKQEMQQKMQQPEAGKGGQREMGRPPSPPRKGY
jgi:Tfp pilus assembly protein PilO